MSQLRISPEGTFFALLYMSKGGISLAVVHRKSQVLGQVAVVRKGSYIDFHWAGDDSMIISRVTPQGGHDVEWVDISFRSKKIEAEAHWFASSGQVIDGLPGNPDKILYGGPGAVFELDRKSVRKGRAWDAPQRRADHDDNALRWVSDANGEIRAALTYREGERDAEGIAEVVLETWFRTPGERDWALVASVPEDERASFTPVGFTADGERLIVASNRERELFALLEVEPETGKEVRVIYEHPTAEINSVLFGPGGRELLGVVVYSGGEEQHHYFEGTYEKHAADLAAVLPDVTVRIQGASNDETVFSVYASLPQGQGRFYVVDVVARTAIDMGSVAPWLDGVELAMPRRFTVRAEGGPEVEAFFTVAESTEARPALIVVPHGGPVGVRDDVSFDPFVQLLAHRGYAVLQVNFRGSGGFGRTFTEAGIGEWGKGIELDIAAAVDHVVAEGWVDPDRMAVFGGSYGGYSALMNVVLYPDRYRCAASFAGVTDLTLLFDEHPPKHSKRGYRTWVRQFGDPETEFEDMKRRSPVYRASEIRVPVLLIQGARDRSVDVEHAYRMKLMLEKHKAPHSAIILRNADHFLRHGPDQTEWLDKLLYFLEKNLVPREQLSAR